MKPSRLLGALSVAVFAFVAGCASSPFDPVASRFRHRIPFEIGQTEFDGTNHIDIVELWGTRPKIEVGGDYLVVCRYRLESGDHGRVRFYETTSNWVLGGADTDLLSSRVERGTGEITLVHSMAGPGWFHVELSAEGDRHGVTVANVYFGHGDNLLRDRAATPPAR